MVAAGSIAAEGVRAQCPAASWLPDSGLPGTDDIVFAITEWDPDGAGPATSLWIIGGSFQICGDVPAKCIAAYNPVTRQFSTLGSGMNNWVMSLATLSTGELVAGGYFTTAGGVSARGIARWNGVNWSALGNGVVGASSAAVMALTTLPNGHLVAGGFFGQAGTVSARNVARWNGTSWSAMGNGLGNSPAFDEGVRSVVVAPNGDLIAGGGFTTLGGSGTGAAANHLARWNGATWSALGAGVNGFVYAVAVLNNGDIVAACPALVGTGVNGSPPFVGRWDGSTWSPLGTAPTSVLSLAVLPDGTLLAGGYFGVQSWDGTSWTSQSTLEFSGSFVYAIRTFANNDWIAGGRFSKVNGTTAYNIAFHDGVSWSALADGIDGTVYALGQLSDGDYVIGGSFTTFSNADANCIVKGNGTTWLPLGTGISGGTKAVYAVTELPNGDVIAAGDFTTVGGVSANRIARWDGATWTPLGGGLNATVRAVIALPNGNVVAAGDFNMAGGVSAFRVAQWDGSQWTGLDGLFNGLVYALTRLPNGDIVAGGNFTFIDEFFLNHRLARWNGVNWSAFGDCCDGAVYALTTQTDGQLLAGGSFSSIGGISALRVARFNGTNWSSLGFGGGTVYALESMPNGDVIAGGSSLSIRTGSTWSALGGGLLPIGSSSPTVRALDVFPNGQLLIGGRFAMGGSQAIANFARYHQPGWPNLAQHPSDATACALGSTTFNVSTTGPAPLTYRWQMLDANSPYVWINLVDGPITNGGQSIGIAGGSSTPTLTIYAAIDSGNEIEARFRCVVSNSCASPASNVAALHVLPWGTGDGDANGVVDGRDITAFVNQLISGGGPGTAHCTFDMDYSGAVDTDDVPLFIAALLIGL